MGFIAYTKEGKRVEFIHKIDWYTAINGKFFKNPPGVVVDEPVVIDEPVVVEEIQDIEIPEPETNKLDAVSEECETKPEPKKSTKKQTIKRMAK